jgi:hypothetical protein
MANFEEDFLEAPDCDSLPLDLSEWIDPRTLMAWILEEIAGLDWSEPDHSPVESPGYSPKTMLEVLCFAYATGVFHKDGAIRACNAPAPLGTSFEQGAPFPAELVQFRRQNRGRLALVLARILARVVRERFDLQTPILSAELKRRLHQNAVERLDIARHMDA